MHFALSALNQATIAAPGPLGRAITFRAFSAQDNNLRIKCFAESGMLVPLKRFRRLMGHPGHLAEASC
jgi:hypothetical protein